MVQLAMPKLELQMPNPDKPEITNYKHQITNKFQLSNKIKSQLFGILNFGHCDLFVICDLKFFITETRHLKSQAVTYNMLSKKGP